MDRIQGTDGIRRPVLPSDDPQVAGRTPQEAFLERGVITEQFMELYTYAFTRQVCEACVSEVPPEIVIGWDPRDPAGLYTGAAVRGIRKAGATAVVLGIAPTPCVALYMVWRGAWAAFMVTASHNFRDQNGIKIFRAPGALKLFPEDDRVLTRAVLGLNYAEEVAELPETGVEMDAAAEARRVFGDFHIDPRNTWLPEGEKLGSETLIVDPANGALTGIGAEVFRILNGGPVVETNADTRSGDVNRKSGVADLEGVPLIERGDLRFKEHRAVRELFERGGKAVIFDADGDRFYCLVYDRDADRAYVLSGDETAAHQAAAMAPVEEGTLFINTVESDLNAALRAQELGYTPLLTGVGDKWILRHAAEQPSRYGIGSEETGHNISKGVVCTAAGMDVDFYAGNGLKSALNTLVAIRGLPMDRVRHPFAPGFKRTFYAYYTRKEMFYEASEVFAGVDAVIREACALGEVDQRVFDEERDMLYLWPRWEDGRQRAGIFVRNSGTEHKTGVNVRGGVEDAAALEAVGEAAVLYLAETMKDREHPMFQAEMQVLQALSDGPLEEEALPVPSDVHRERLIEELANKEKVMRRVQAGYERTEFGTKMLERLS